MAAGVNLGRLSSQWVRRRYYTEGDYIKPVRGSKIETYDPFQFYVGPGSAREGISLYIELARLNVDDRRAIEEFTSKWGLLGLFYHNLREVRYRRVRLADGQPGGYPSPGFHDLRVDSDQMAFDDYSGFADLLAHGEWEATAELRGEENMPLRLYGMDYLPDLLNDPPATGEREEQSLEHRLFVVLHSPMRWDYLAEPLDGFRAAVKEFQNVYSGSARWREQYPVEDHARHLADSLAKHVRHVHPIPIYVPAAEASATGDKSGRWESGWSFPSLQAAAYMMLLEDLAGNRHQCFCANQTCGKPFVTDRADRKYCSPGCNNSEKQRRFRQKRQD